MIHSKNSTFRQQAKVKTLIVQALLWPFIVTACNTAMAQGQGQGPAQGQAQGQGQSLGQGMGQNAMPTPSTPGQYQSAPPRSFASTDSMSFGDRLSHLENTLGLGQAPPDAPILDRIARVEQRSFGQVRQGSILDRLKALEANEHTPAQQPQQFNPAQQPQQFNPAQQPQYNQTPSQGFYPPATMTPAMVPPNSAAVPQPAQSTAGTAQFGGSLPPPQMAAPVIAPLAPQATPTIKPGRLADIIKHAHVASLVTLPDVYPPSFLRVEPSDSDRPPDGSDYLKSVMTESKNKVLKFERMPVPVYITPIQEYGFPKAIKEAFADWESRTKGLITFTEVKSPNDARIIIKFSRLGLKSGNDCSLGAHTMTNWKARGAGRLAFLPVGSIPVPLYIPAMGPKYSVPPQVIEVNLDVIYSHEEELRLLLLKNITAHELGHALGMLGHSPTEGDMMYPITDEHSRLSQRDINTITRLYQRKADIPLQ